VLSLLVRSHHSFQTIIKHLRWGLPRNAENNPVLWGEVVSLIQTRSAAFRLEKSG
jgi:hypothetical protein